MNSVYIDEANGFGIAVSPKVGSTSIVHFLFEFLTGKRGEWPEVNHQLDGFDLGHDICWGQKRGIPLIAVHRNPLDRIRSTYLNRVVHHGEAPDRGFRNFCERLDYYNGFPSIRWHLHPQIRWLGSDESVYDFILPISKLHLLPSLVATLSGKPTPSIGHEQRSQGETPPDVDSDLAEILQPWIAADLSSGWDGKMFRLPGEIDNEISETIIV